MLREQTRPATRPLIVYIASSVTNAPLSYRRFIQEVKNKLRMETPALVLEWIEKDAPLGEHFYARDLENIRSCDAMIAFLEMPSIGVGMEIAQAISTGKPLLCLSREGAGVSRLLLSAQQSIGLRIKSYRTLQEATALASAFIEEEARERPY